MVPCWHFMFMYLFVLVIFCVTNKLDWIGDNSVDVADRETDSDGTIGFTMDGTPNGVASIGAR